jgi:hypothetical protein
LQIAANPLQNGRTRSARLAVDQGAPPAQNRFWSDFSKLALFVEWTVAGRPDRSLFMNGSFPEIYRPLVFDFQQRAGELHHHVKDGWDYALVIIQALTLLAAVGAVIAAWGAYKKQAAQVTALEKQVEEDAKARVAERLSRSPNFRMASPEGLVTVSVGGSSSKLEDAFFAKPASFIDGDEKPSKGRGWILLSNRRKAVDLSDWVVDATCKGETWRCPMWRVNLLHTSQGDPVIPSHLWALAVGERKEAWIETEKLSLKISFETADGYEDSHTYELVQMGYEWRFTRVDPESILDKSPR